MKSPRRAIVICSLVALTTVVACSGPTAEVDTSDIDTSSVGLEPAQSITVFETAGGADGFSRNEILTAARTYPSLLSINEMEADDALGSALAFLMAESHDVALAEDISSPFMTVAFSDIDQAGQFQELIATYNGVAGAVGPNGPKLGTSFWTIEDPQTAELRHLWWQAVNSAANGRS